MIQNAKGASYTWRSICKVWDEFSEGLGWRIGKGDKASFWFDKWSPLPKPLIYYAVNADKICHLRVQEFLTPSGNWNVDRLKCFLPQDIIRSILLVKATSNFGQEDSLCWRPSNDGHFSIKSAYNFMSDSTSNSRSLIWTKIWRWPTYEKIKFFLWKLAWNRLPIGSYQIGNLGNDCPNGCNQPISPMHVIRDCPEARKVWLRLINPNLATNFFTLSMQDWILWNARKKAGNDKARRLPWQELFAQTCWLLWKDRCTKTFSPDHHKDIDIAFLSTHIVMEDLKFKVWSGKLGNHGNLNKTHWSPPDKDWIRLDIDGSVSTLGEATCGGIIRDHLGNWKYGFSKKLGFLPITTAELHGMREGLHLCWNKGFRKIKMYTDSMEALQSIVSIHDSQHPLFSVVQDIRNLLMRDWQVIYDHMYREANHCADWLAQFAHNIEGDFQLLLCPPEDCLHLLYRDLEGFRAPEGSILIDPT